MALNYKVLGQSSPSATTNTTLYTVPAQKEAVVSSIVVVNRGSSGTFRIAVRPNAETIANKHYIAYDETLSSNTRVTLTLGITLDAADVVTIYASSADFSFNAFGVEIQ